MKKRKSILCLLINLTFLINGNFLLSESFANPLPIPMEYYMGSIFTNASLPFNLINADVVFTIDSTDFKNNIGISFEGNYTIFNPNNTTEIMIVAPFSVNRAVVSSNCIVEINDSQILFDVGDPYDLGIEEWVMDYSSYFPSWTYIVCNITIPENNSQTIKYKFNGLMPNPLNPLSRNNEFSILYDLVTSKAWSGTISERVEFRVYGKLPDSIIESPMDEDRLVIINIDEGKSYTWEWTNEQINTERIGIMYETELLKLQLIIIGVSIGIAVTITVATIIFVVRTKKRSKLKE
ncbi:MAG: hypothetical protein ACXADU_00700 [Promethearchaeota archaeon]|jgi:hypothetical protein